MQARNYFALLSVFYVLNNTQLHSQQIDSYQKKLMQQEYINQVTKSSAVFTGTIISKDKKHGDIEYKLAVENIIVPPLKSWSDTIDVVSEDPVDIGGRYLLFVDKNKIRTLTRIADIDYILPEVLVTANNVFVNSFSTRTEYYIAGKPTFKLPEVLQGLGNYPWLQYLKQRKFEQRTGRLLGFPM